MRILFVNKLYAPDIAGGAEIVLGMHAAAAQLQGHEVRVATTTSADAPLDDEVAGVQVSRVPLKNIYWHHGPTRASGWQRMVWHARDSNNRAMAQSFDTVVQSFEPQLIVFHNLSGFSASVWRVAQQRRVPSLQVLHDYYHLCPRSHLLKGGHDCASICTSCRLMRVGRAPASNQLNAVVGVSQAVLKAHTDNGLFGNVPIHRVIYNARQMGLAQPPRQRTQARSFGFIGSLTPWKGIELLLDAFKQLSARRPELPLKLLVAGDGEEAYVRALRERYASERIEFVGRVKPEAFFERIDVSVVPSLWRDPLPGVVYESMLCGVPVIGSRRGGIPEMIRDGANGLLFDPDEPDALGGALARMADDPVLLQTCSLEAPVSAAPFADLSRMGTEYEALYKEVVDSCHA